GVLQTPHGWPIDPRKHLRLGNRLADPSQRKVIVISADNPYRVSLRNWHGRNRAFRERYGDLYTQVEDLLYHRDDADEADYIELYDKINGLTNREELPKLTEEDRYILMVLDANKGRALTNHQIEMRSSEMNQDSPKKIKRLSDKMIRKRM